MASPVICDNQAVASKLNVGLTTRRIGAYTAVRVVNVSRTGAGLLYPWPWLRDPVYSHLATPSPYGFGGSVFYNRIFVLISRLTT
jgi:hypothetical protein